MSFNFLQHDIRKLYFLYEVGHLQASSLTFDETCQQEAKISMRHDNS